MVGGGVTAVMMGVALSTIVGNILSGGLVLTTFPARIGDLVLVVSDKEPGGIDEATPSKIRTTKGSEYSASNNAIIQGTTQIVKEAPGQRQQRDEG